jgi:hypothetical protein
MLFSQGKNMTLKNKVDRLTEQVSTLQTDISHLQDSIKNRNLVTKKLIDKQEFKNEILEQRIQQASDTIKNQNSLFNGFGIIYSIITIVMTLIAIGLPIITYQFGVKPSQNALKELETNLDNKVAAYLEKTRNEQVKKSIEHLKGDNNDLKGQAISFLSLTQHEGFSDEQMFEFFRLLKSDKLSDTHKGTVAYLLSSRVNDYANEIFSDKEQLKNNAIKSSAYQYIPKAGISKFIKPLINFLKDNSNQYGEFWTLITITQMYSKSTINELINNKELIDILKPETLVTMKTGIKSLLDNLEIDENIFKKTYLYKKIETASS